ncbi:MAG: hypothetical protein KGR98_00990, partial [Verrucomicrobia bacterium]|nr:hypothetical protein [Verrucomicrobiota bacterium]
NEKRFGAHLALLRATDPSLAGSASDTFLIERVMLRFADQTAVALSDLYYHSFYYGYRYYNSRIGLARNWGLTQPADEALSADQDFEAHMRYFGNTADELCVFVHNDPVDGADMLGEMAGGHRPPVPPPFPPDPDQCACKKAGGKWTPFNGYDSWADCMDKNWPTDPPSSGPPVTYGGDIPPGLDQLQWLLESAICHFPGCSKYPSHFFIGS